jgi:hypothetical protein
MVYSNGTLLGTTTANNSGNWTFNNTGTALADGTYTLTATATDQNGNVSASSYPYGVTIDTTLPTPPTISGIVDGTVLGSTATTTTSTTTDSTPVFFGIAQPYSNVSLYQGSMLLGTVAADGYGNWQYTDSKVMASVALNGNGGWNFYSNAISTGGLISGGQYSFTAQATDIAGNTSSPSAIQRVTLAPPPATVQAATVFSASLSIGSILSTNADGSFNTIAAPTISGVATANSDVAVFDDGVIIGQAVVNSTGGWSFTSPTLLTGQHQLTFEAVNSLGIFSAAAYPITIQV